MHVILPLIPCSVSDHCKQFSATNVTLHWKNRFKAFYRRKKAKSFFFQSSKSKSSTVHTIYVQENIEYPTTALTVTFSTARILFALYLSCIHKIVASSEYTFDNKSKDKKMDDMKWHLCVVYMIGSCCMLFCTSIEKKIGVSGEYAI